MGALLPQHVPQMGDMLGCPQLLVGPGVGSQVGTYALLLNVRDVRAGRGRLMLFVDLPPAAAEPLSRLGRTVPPTWPLLEQDGAGELCWDGLTSVHDAEGIHLNGRNVSWVADRAGLHVCVVGARQSLSPDELLWPLQQARLVDGWASDQTHERRWLRENVTVAAPRTVPPDDAQIRDLKVGLAALAGWGHPDRLVQAGYDPEPQVRAGQVVSRRIRNLRGPDQTLRRFRASFRVGPHRHGPGSLPAVLTAGRITSLRVRRVTGSAATFGWSTVDDAAVGTSHLLELELDEHDAPMMPPPALIWTDPASLFVRLDTAVFGQVPTAPLIPGSPPRDVPVLDPSGLVLTATRVRWPSLTVTGTLDLYGPEGPDLIVVRDPQEQQQTVALLGQLGVRHLGPRTLDQAVQIHPAYR